MSKAEAVQARVRWYEAQGVDYETALAIVQREGVELGTV